MLANCGVATTIVYKGLVALGHEVQLFTFYDERLAATQPPGDLEALNAEFLPRKLKWSPPLLARTLRRELKRRQPDVFHAHVVTPYGFGAALANWHPWILTAHGSDVYLDAFRSKSPLIDRLAPGPIASIGFRLFHGLVAATVDKVVVYSPDLMEHLPRLGYPETKLVPCFLGVDTAMFRPIPHPPRPSGVLTVICARHLDPVYDHKTLFDSVAALRDQGIPVRLRIAGGGPLRESLERYAGNLGIGASIEFMGVVPHDRLPEVLNAADVLVSTARSDTTGLSILEGMACGLPVVSTRVGAIRERVIDGRNGFLFEPGDSRALAAHLRELAKFPMLRRDMGVANIELVQREFDIRKTIACLEAVYEGCAREA